MLSHILLPTSHSVTFPALQARLTKLMAERAEPGADTESIDARIWEMFGEEWAIMFTDLAGFSRAASEFGICHFMQVIFESFRVYIPIIEELGGMLLKVEGDSMMVLFRSPASALQAAVGMQNASREYNKGRDEAARLLLSVGLGFGRVLKFGDLDVYGQEVNYACKLGEDIGKDWEIYCSDNFRQALADRPELKFEQQEYPFHGADIHWRHIYDQ